MPPSARRFAVSFFHSMRREAWAIIKIKKMKTEARRTRTRSIFLILEKTALKGVSPLQCKERIASGRTDSPPRRKTLPNEKNIAPPKEYAPRRNRGSPSLRHRMLQRLKSPAPHKKAARRTLFQHQPPMLALLLTELSAQLTHLLFW